jgi:TctA family transporter
MFDGVRDAWHNKRLVIQSSAVGSFLGLIPGMGGPAIDWITYGVARSTSRNSETFGQGDIRGVIGPESANNSKEGGQLVPTLLFGIPAGSTSAMLLGGLVILGIQVGPDMVSTNLNVTLAIIWTLALANVFAAAACFGLSRWVSKISLIKATSLVPFLFVLLIVASYQNSMSWGDIYALCAFGVLGWVLKHVGWPRPPLLIGFILAGPAEDYLHLSVSLYGTSWLTYPSVIGIGSFTILVLLATTIRFRKTPDPAPAVPARSGART